MLLNKFMPVYDFNDVHSIVIQASPRYIFNSLHHLTPADIALVRVLLGIRSLPAPLLGKQGPIFTETEPFLKQMLEAGFVLLAHYWRLIYPGSALIRIMWLKALKRRAEAESIALSQAKA